MNYDENGKQLRSRSFHDKSDKPESLAKATNSSKICLGIIPDSENRIMKQDTQKVEKLEYHLL